MKEIEQILNQCEGVNKLHIKPNISIVNALIRITIGLTVVAWGTARFSRRPWRDSYLFMILLGAMKVAEGIVRFCPVTLFCQKYFQNGKGMNGSEESLESLEGIDEEEEDNDSYCST